MRIYAKVIMGNKDSKVWISFYDTKQNKVDAASLEGVHCNVYPALLFDSLYFWSGSNASSLKQNYWLAPETPKSRPAFSTVNTSFLNRSIKKTLATLP